jgi:hypothetical protein
MREAESYFQLAIEHEHWEERQVELPKEWDEYLTEKYEEVDADA